MASARTAVLLSGCGFLDGAEIQEAVLALLALDQHRATVVCCAPDINQPSVIDHQTQQPTHESRNTIKEAARIARGQIRDVANVQMRDFDALVIPGGFGAAKTLCNFAERGAECTVQHDVEALLSDALRAKKPIAALCIAPALLARVAGKLGVRARLTIGNDVGVAHAIAMMGCVHEQCAVTECVVDEVNRIVSTPAYMLATGPADVWEGVRKSIDALFALRT